MAKLVATPGQTVGPFFGYALPFAGGGDLVDRTHPAAVRLHGTVFDGAGAVIPDAIVELWQADESGNIAERAGSLNRDGFTFTGFGRAAVDDAGHYQFVTVEPGSVDGSLPFFMITVFARGLLDKLHTRAYLPSAVDSLGESAVLSGLGERAQTLITRRDEQGNLVFDIRLQGDDETVFFDFGG